MTAQVVGSLPLMREIRIEFSAPGFGLTQAWLLWVSGGVI